MKLKLKNITKSYVAGDNKVIVISTLPERIVYIGTMKELKNSDIRFFKRLRKSKLVSIRYNYKYFKDIYLSSAPDRIFKGYTVFQVDTKEKALKEDYIINYKETF